MTNMAVTCAQLLKPILSNSLIQEFKQCVTLVGHVCVHLGSVIHTGKCVCDDLRVCLIHSIQAHTHTKADVQKVCVMT